MWSSGLAREAHGSALPARKRLRAAYGSRTFGYRTVWVNRFKLPAERLGKDPDRIASNMDGLVEFFLGIAAKQQKGVSRLARPRFRGFGQILRNGTFQVEMHSFVPESFTKR